MDYVIKDSGKRQEFDTGAVRDIQENKGRFDLLPAKAITKLAVHFEKGAKKYGDNNWQLGIPAKRYVDSAMRHLFKYMDGQEDEDHLVACCWNIICLLETREMVANGELDPALMILKEKKRWK